MNRESQEKWINSVLNEVFQAVIEWEPLRNALIFKGARILNLHLGDSRQSLDIDSNIAPELAMTNPNVDAQANFLEQQLPLALRRYFERQTPVKYKLVRVKVYSILLWFGSHLLMCRARGVKALVSVLRHLN